MSLHLAFDRDAQLEIAITEEMNKFCHAVNRDIAVYHENKMKLLIAQRSDKQIKKMEEPIFN